MPDHYYGTAPDEWQDLGKRREPFFGGGEERDGAGMKKANELGIAWETVIFGELSEHKLVAGHKRSTSLRDHSSRKGSTQLLPRIG